MSMAGKQYTADEDAKLTATYPVSGASGAAAVLPGRTRASIINRATALGLKSGITKGKAWVSGLSKWDGDWCPPTQDTAADHRLWMAVDRRWGGERRLAA